MFGLLPYFTRYLLLVSDLIIEAENLFLKGKEKLEYVVQKILDALKKDETFIVKYPIEKILIINLLKSIIAIIVAFNHLKGIFKHKKEKEEEIDEDDKNANIGTKKKK